jgi:hypothetical protein
MIVRRYGLALSIGPNRLGFLPDDGGRAQSSKRFLIKEQDYR